MALTYHAMRRVATAFAYLVAMLPFFALASLLAQEPILLPVLNQHTSGGSAPELVEHDLDFNDEQYLMFEKLLDVPNDKGSDFYRAQIVSLTGARQILSARWYRRRVAEIIKKIDDAIDKSATLFDSSIENEQRELFSQLNSFVRRDDSDGLHSFIRELEKLDSNKRRFVATDQLMVAAFEACYAMRIRDFAIAGDFESVSSILEDVVKTDNRFIANCAPELAKLVELYHSDMARNFADNFTEAYSKSKDFEIRKVAQIPHNQSFFTPDPKPGSATPYSYEPIGKTETINLFDVPEDRDLNFYRKLYKEFLSATVESAKVDVSSSLFSAQRDQALEDVLRHIVMSSIDAKSEIDLKELEEYVTQLFHNGHYHAAIELKKLDVIPNNPNSPPKVYFEVFERQYFNNLLAWIQESDAARRQEIIREFVYGVENGANVFEAFENHENRLKNSDPQFLEELRNAICQAGMRSNDPAMLVRVKKLTAPERPSNALIGKKVDLRGLDLNEKPFDANGVEGRPILLYLTSNPNRIQSVLSDERFGKHYEAGRLALVGYLTSEIDSIPSYREAERNKYDAAVTALKNDPHPTLSQRLAKSSNNLRDTDYPLLGIEYDVKDFLYLLIDSDGKIVAVFDKENLDYDRYWRLTQAVDNLVKKNNLE